MARLPGPHTSPALHFVLDRHVRFGWYKVGIWGEIEAVFVNQVGEGGRVGKGTKTSVSWQRNSKRSTCGCHSNTSVSLIHHSAVVHTKWVKANNHHFKWSIALSGRFCSQRIVLAHPLQIKQILLISCSYM